MRSSEAIFDLSSQTKEALFIFKRIFKTERKLIAVSPTNKCHKKKKKKFGRPQEK